MNTTKESVLREFRTIPGVGKSISNDLWEMGFRSKSEFENRDPEELYQRFCTHQGMQVDRCVLYVCRCIVYFTSNKNHEPELLKWWNWKNRE